MFGIEEDVSSSSSAPADPIESAASIASASFAAVIADDEKAGLLPGSTGSSPQPSPAFIFALLFSGMASNLAWAVQIGYTSPMFEQLGLSTSMLALAWLAGPISGIIVQPVVGRISDSCSSGFGRRRPFIMLGTCLIVLSLTVFSHAAELGEWLGDVNGSHRRALALAVTAFWVLDCSINMVTAPTRALIVDFIPPSAHPVANAFLALHGGIGNAIGYLLGSLDLHALMPIFRRSVQSLYAVAAMLIFVLSSITMLLAQEKQMNVGTTQTNFSHRDAQRHHFCLSVPSTIGKEISDTFSRFKKMPSPISRVFMVQFFSMFAWFSLMIFTTVWFARDVYGGDPSADPGSDSFRAYQAGIHQGNLALLCKALSSACFSPLIPFLIRTFGLRLVFSASQTVLALILLLASALSVSPAVDVLMFAGLGLPFAATNTIPWMVVTMSLSKTSDAALFAATFNLSQCIPDIIVSFISGPILTVFNDRITSMFVMGAFGAMVASALVYIVQVPEPHLSDTAVPEEDVVYETVEAIEMSSQLQLRRNSGIIRSVEA